jgi:proteic killer suppression protein
MLSVMIRSFANRETERVFKRERVGRFSNAVQRQAHRKLLLLDAAESIEDLRVPPGNRLEALRTDREGQHSIRVSKRWRICFTWRADGPHDVEIVDYHRG